VIKHVKYALILETAVHNVLNYMMILFMADNIII